MTSPLNGVIRTFTAQTEQAEKVLNQAVKGKSPKRDEIVHSIKVANNALRGFRESLATIKSLQELDHQIDQLDGYLNKTSTLLQPRRDLDFLQSQITTIRDQVHQLKKQLPLEIEETPSSFSSQPRKVTLEVAESVNQQRRVAIELAQKEEESFDSAYRKVGAGIQIGELPRTVSIEATSSDSDRISKTVHVESEQDPSLEIIGHSSAPEAVLQTESQPESELRVQPSTSPEPTAPKELTRWDKFKDFCDKVWEGVEKFSPLIGIIGGVLITSAMVTLAVTTMIPPLAIGTAGALAAVGAALVIFYLAVWIRTMLKENRAIENGTRVYSYAEKKEIKKNYDQQQEQQRLNTEQRLDEERRRRLQEERNQPSPPSPPPT